MKVAIYARVSDDKKKSDGERRQDVQRQVKLLIEYCKRAGYENVEKYIDDGKSAFTEDWNARPDFKRLINDCRRHFVQKVIVEDMTRFSRRIDLGLPLLRELGQLNVHLMSLKEDELEVTSAQGWMKSSMLLMFAEWDSRLRGEKIKSGMRKAQNLGKKIGGFRKKKERKHKIKQEGVSYTPPNPLKSEELNLVERDNL